MTTRLQQLLGTRLPIIQAPMAGVQGHALAAAVCEAGGLGSLPGAMFDAASLAAEVGRLAARTSRPFNVNFFCHRPPVADPGRDAVWRAALAPYFAEAGLDLQTPSNAPTRAPFDGRAADALEAFRPRVVSFHFGLPSTELLDRVRSWGSTVLSTATTVDEARWLAGHGVDAVIAQGLEAGGHRGFFRTDDLTTQSGTFALVPQIVRAIDLPVIATGGIVDAAGVAAALALGASGVQLGTAYLLCPESTTGAVHRAALQSEAAAHTALTRLFSGGAARGIVNRLMRELGPMSSLAPAFPLASAGLAALRAEAESDGRGDFSPLWCGQNASRCRPVAAATLTRELMGA